MLLCHSLVYQQRCQKTSSMGPLQCLAMKHLSPNAFKWFPRAGKMWVFGREDDPFPSFGSLPQMEVLLGGISADGGNRGCTKPLESCPSMQSWLQSPVLITLAPLIGLGFICPITFKSTLTSTLWSLCTQTLWWISWAEYVIMNPKIE